MEANHTPGPWTIERPYAERGLFVSRGNRAATNPLICRVREGQPESEANARLIAAAPELLEALHDLLTERDKYGGCPPSSPAWDIARAVLAKATTT